MSEKTDRIVAARLRLMERFRARQLATRGLSDPEPQGEGPPNRHGMPKIPVGQVATAKWPVLDLGTRPEITPQEWRLTVDGAVRRPVTLTWDEFRSLEQVTDTSDFHCVTTWSRMDLEWVGVRFSTLSALAAPLDEATHVMCHAADGYSTNLPLEEALKDDVLLAHTVDGRPLPREHGGPVRMVTPQLYAWKGAKWIVRIELMIGDRPGFWEMRGYSNTAHPWRNDRYSS
jgi:DMSO/TMAO reductase YedYZ molybdopterin-dependent catalytic subunit